LTEPQAAAIKFPRDYACTRKKELPRRRNATTEGRSEVKEQDSKSGKRERPQKK